jgi:uncharacterized membrane protein
MHDDRHDDPFARRSLTRPTRRGDNAAWIALGVGALLGAAGYAVYQQRTRNPVAHRPADSAPGRTARQRRFGRYAVVGRTVTINRPRGEVYAFWRDFQNLPQFMENVRGVEVAGDVTRWSIRGPMGRDVGVETRIVADDQDALIAWRSIDASEIDTEGKVTFRDAPAGRGTEVEAIIAYVPPGGELGRWVAKVLQAEPELQARRDLKRLKMLMEAGEIATARNRKAA